MEDPTRVVLLLSHVVDDVLFACFPKRTDYVDLVVLVNIRVLVHVDYVVSVGNLEPEKRKMVGQWLGGHRACDGLMVALRIVK